MHDATHWIELASGVIVKTEEGSDCAACLRARVDELQAARDETREIAEALYDEGVIDVDHEDDCPADDTCKCHSVARVNLLYALLHDDADTAKRMRAILRGRGDQ